MPTVEKRFDFLHSCTWTLTSSLQSLLPAAAVWNSGLRAAARIISIQTKCLRSKSGLTSCATVLGRLPKNYKLLHTFYRLKIMKETKDIYMMNLSDWKPMRTVSFTLQNRPAKFIYFRPLRINKLAKEIKPDPFFSGKKIISLNQPIDRIDELVLYWFQQFDPNANLTHRLLSFSTDEDDVRKFYEGLPSVQLKIWINPAPTSDDQIYLSKFENQSFAAYERRFNIRVSGYIDPNTIFPVDTIYPLEEASKIKELLNIASSEIIPLD
ncbi:MAG: hypothetical protein NC453_12695 [Muribaculum sp.]|nr:hypothetical protein [Muribaculum sp.]